MLSNTTFIYALCDPETHIVRYIGKTNNIEARYKKHLKDDDRTFKTNWINTLRAQGKLPLIKIIEEVDRNLWEECEKKWIAYYREISGDKLTNTTNGGDGGSSKGFRKGHIVSEETRKKISESNKGRKQPEEERLKRRQSLKDIGKRFPEKYKKLSETLKGRFFSEETRKKISEKRKGVNNRIGYRHSLETINKIRESNKNPSDERRKAMSERMKNKKPSEETRKKISESNKGKHGHKHSIETKLKIAEYHKGKPLSKETRDKISVARRLYFQRKKLDA